MSHLTVPPVPPDNVVVLPCVTSHDIPCERVLNAAIGKVTQVIVIGYEEDGTLYFAASTPGGPENLWLLREAQRALETIGGMK